MPDVTKGLPAWAIPVTIGGVALLALLHSKSAGTSSGQVGNVTTLAPTPVDPGVVAMSASETAARTSVITSLINSIGSQAISTTSANRDVAISGINASVANQRTAASEAVGLAATDAQVKESVANATAAADINRTNVAGATSVAHIQGKTAMGNTIVNGIKAVGSAIAGLFGF